MRVLLLYPRALLLSGTVAVVIFVSAAVLAARDNRSEPRPSELGAIQLDSTHDWPMRGGSPQRNMANFLETKLPGSWNIDRVQPQRIKWSVSLGSKAYGGPVVASGKIFVGTNNDRPRNPRDIEKDTKLPIDRGILMCFEEATGKFLWQAVHDKLPAGRVNDWPRVGIASTPAVEGNRVYYVSNRCELVCADTNGFLDEKNDGVKDEQYTDKTDADFIWRLDMMKELDVFPHNLAVSSPLILGDLVFVTTGNGVDEGHLRVPHPKAPSFLAVDKKTGRVAWSDNSPTARLLDPGANANQLAQRGLCVMHGQWSSPVVAEVKGSAQVIFPGGDGWLYAFRPASGLLIWKFDGNAKDAIYKLGGGATRNDFVFTSGTVHDGKLYIGLGQDPEHDAGPGMVWCLDLEKATRLGGDVSAQLVDKDSADGQTGKPNPNSIALWQFGGLIVPPPEEGREYTFGRTLSSAAVVDGLCYISEQEGILHCLDADTGKEHWQHDMNAAAWGSPYYADGKIYMGNDRGKLLIFAHGKAKKKIAEINMKGYIRATPVAANGVLYVMTENTLYAIAEDK